MTISVMSVAYKVIGAADGTLSVAYATTNRTVTFHSEVIRNEDVMFS